MDLVARHGLEHNVVYSSFNWLSVVKMKRMDPTCRIGLLFSSMPLYGLGAIMRELDVDFYHPDIRDLDEAMMHSLHDNGRGVNVWTVNEHEDIRKAIALGVDGIITNWPGRVLDALGRC